MYGAEILYLSCQSHSLPYKYCTHSGKRGNWKKILFTGKSDIILMELLSSSAPGDFQVSSKSVYIMVKVGLAADVANNQPGVTRH